MLEILTYPFMRHAILAISAIALFAPLLGVFLVLRRQSLLSDTLSHVSLAGVAFGVLFSINPSWTTLIIVILAAIFMEWLRMVYKNYMELATAILMSAGLALALFIINMAGSKSSVSLDQYLFGSILTISSGQVIMLFVIAVIVLVAFIAFMRPLYVMTFDEDTALVDGLPVRLMSLAFNVVTGLAIALMIPICGALLVSAIMVLPASIAMIFGKSFKQVLIFSVVIGFIGMNAGLVASYYYNAPASSAITLIFILLFLLVTLIKRFARG
ncbi:metal ABC transporter permease [Lactococcus termiticola]|uniref:Mn/Zn ABC-type transport system permease protein n=1 Tax=Lactococcus termiticola TaxID=2169526 RepID=A0A2R5HEJ6_9LACT|nr:iron chelate uptake ABC transporter family permease subunit [Lactococcus termiticola]GBG96493.1 Mn/Zn ABC-type transport system permease protein [Lactococcus termiticola]